MSAEPPYPPEPPPYQPPGVPPPQFVSQKESALKGNAALKLLIGSAIGLVVGFGTCGMGALAMNGSRGAGGFFVPLGLTVFGLSLVGLLVSCIWLLVSAIAGWRR